MPLLGFVGTVFGVAAGISGPGRFRFGGVRDFILGVRFVDGLGRLLRMGGKVVKNVAGYDLVRLLTGSWGSLAILTEMTLRTHPLPAAGATLVHYTGYERRAE